jgi:hypothetical protein
VAAALNDNPPEIADRDDRPPSVSRAITLLYVTLGFGLLRSVLEFTRLAGTSNAVFALIIQIMVFALMWLIVFKIGRRREWARILYLVLFILGTPLSVKPLLVSLSATPISGVLGLAQIAIQIYALVLLFRSEGRAWFRPREEV